MSTNKNQYSKMSMNKITLMVAFIVTRTRAPQLAATAQPVFTSVFNLFGSWLPDFSDVHFMPRVRRLSSKKNIWFGDLCTRKYIRLSAQQLACTTAWAATWGNIGQLLLDFLSPSSAGKIYSIKRKFTSIPLHSQKINIHPLTKKRRLQSKKRLLVIPFSKITQPSLINRV